MKLINRGILILKPNQFFLDWLNRLPLLHDTFPHYSLEDIRKDCTAYLLPDVVSEGSIDYILEPIKTNLFETELSDWCSEPALWPPDRTPETFDAWFDLEFHSMVWDLLELPIQSLDEEQEFDPLMDDFPEEDENFLETVKTSLNPDLPFKRQDTVVVKPGVCEPERPHNDLSGWHGRIIDFSQCEDGEIQALVEWDSYTLEQMPPSFITERAERSWDWEAISLPAIILEPADPRDDYDRVERVQARLSALYFWPMIQVAGERISSLLLSIDPADPRSVIQIWHDHLAARLQFPFEACVERNSPGSPALKGDFVTVIDLHQSDPLTGVKALARNRNQVISIPLSYLVVLKESSQNNQFVDDYKLWFDYNL